VDAGGPGRVVVGRGWWRLGTQAGAAACSGGRYATAIGSGPRASAALQGPRVDNKDTAPAELDQKAVSPSRRSRPKAKTQTFRGLRKRLKELLTRPARQAVARGTMECWNKIWRFYKRKKSSGIVGSRRLFLCASAPNFTISEASGRGLGCHVFGRPVERPKAVEGGNGGGVAIAEGNV